MNYDAVATDTAPMKTAPNLRGRFFGAGNRSRTYDLRITNALLYQLSYSGETGNPQLRKGPYSNPPRGSWRVRGR